MTGYDVCASEYQGGVYVFEDTFDHWVDSTSFASNRMVSGRWASTVNAEANSNCGSAGGENALKFSGEFTRSAITLDLDISFGGWIEADLFISPQSFEQHLNCKPNYASPVLFQYSIDGGAVWWTLMTYYPFEYSQEDFFHVQLTVPPHGVTNSTRFKIYQVSCSNLTHTLHNHPSNLVSMYLSVYLSVCLPVCLSIFVSVWLHSF